MNSRPTTVRQKKKTMENHAADIWSIQQDKSVNFGNRTPTKQTQTEQRHSQTVFNGWSVGCDTLDLASTAQHHGDSNTIAQHFPSSVRTTPGREDLGRKS